MIARDAEVLRFLCRQFPETPEADICKAFAWVFEKGRFGTEEDANQRAQSLASLDPEVREQHEIWYRNNSRTGGRNVVAHLLADAVALGFEDLGFEIKFGVVSNGRGPSTAFGKVVEEALDFHGSNADWRRPTEATRKRAKKIS